jgi:phosphotriesterase-related protein
MLIDSVSGKLDTKDLGITLMHEHVATIDHNMRNAFEDWFDQATTVKEFETTINRVKPYGLKTIVDCTPINLGRDINLIKAAAEEAEIQMLASTGIYAMEEPWISRTMDESYLAEYYLRDINNGIQGTNIKPALIKCATDPVPGKTEMNRKMLQAAAIASKESEIPIYTHSSCVGRLGLYQQELLMAEGVAPHKIVIGHAFDSCELNYLEELLNNGTYIGCDRVGLDIVCPTDKLADCVAALCQKGFAKQIFLSHDNNLVSDFAFSFARFRRDRQYNPVLGGYHEVFEVMIPMLLERGVVQADIDTMLLHNPRRYFEGVPF